MCGIAGIFAYREAAQPVNSEELLRIRDAMRNRGPDGEGLWISADQRVGFAHRRLAIIDLSDAGAQPMVSADGTLIITFNGEIYNYRELRRELETRGYIFYSNSDTEVLLHLYAERGVDMVHALRGMFAFAIWDVRRRALLLARDPYGIKPLYYADDGSAFRFASQVKALLAGGAISRDEEPAGWIGFFLFGSVPEPFTTCRSIRAVPAGSTVWVDERGARGPRQYFSVAESFIRAEREQPNLRADELQQRFREALLDSVRHHLVADVPVGAFLSSGIDSGALVGLMRDAGQQDLQTLTLTFEEFRGRDHDEAPVAAMVARHYGVRHSTRVISEREFREDLPNILEAMDQPTIDGINAWFVSKGVRELGLKVAISGLGGDELLGGYSSFRDIPRCVNWMAIPSRIPCVGEAFRAVVSALVPLSRKIHPKSAGLVKYGGDYLGAYLLRRAVFMPWELGRFLDKDMVREGLARLGSLTDASANAGALPQTAFGKVASLETANYMRNQLLRDADWASMAHSLEVRVPLVDATLLNRIAPLMVGPIKVDGKVLLGRSPKRPLPESVIQRPKTGFATPVEQWLKRNAQYGARPNSSILASRCATTWPRQWACQIAARLA